MTARVQKSSNSGLSPSFTLGITGSLPPARCSCTLNSAQPHNGGENVVSTGLKSCRGAECTLMLTTKSLRFFNFWLGSFPPHPFCGFFFFSCRTGTESFGGSALCRTVCYSTYSTCWFFFCVCLKYQKCEIFEALREALEVFVVGFTPA